MYKKKYKHSQVEFIAGMKVQITLKTQDKNNMIQHIRKSKKQNDTIIATNEEKQSFMLNEKQTKTNLSTSQ